MNSFKVFVSASIILATRLEAGIIVDASQVTHPVSRYLTGSCLEDVNHEVYGGIYSQMIFGESFAEPVPQQSFEGFTTFGRWSVASDSGVHVVGGEGSKMVAEGSVVAEGEASVDLKFNDTGSGNAGMIVKVSDVGKGHDQFTGYEISLQPEGTLLLGRHRQNWEFIKIVPCNVPTNQWIHLAVQMTQNSLKILVDGKLISDYTDNEHPLATGAVGLRTWQRDVNYRNFIAKTDHDEKQFAFKSVSSSATSGAVSEMWRPVQTASARGHFELTDEHPFSGRQSQKVEFISGEGEIGIENRGLNRWGMNFVAGKTYEGFVYVRAPKPTTFSVSLQGAVAQKADAEKRLKASSADWQRIDFQLKPESSESNGCFVLKLKKPGSITFGYVFLQPGEWGRFKGLPVRRDVGQGIVDEGNTVLRYGGSMVNADTYRWKQMIGPREFRQPCAGHWYPYSTMGWSIFEFLNYCEAAKILGIPDLSIDEAPQDMADFMDYINGSSKTEWGAKRKKDGHARPYHLKYMELGNEERVDEHYFEKFSALAKTIWAKDPEIILIVGDFLYNDQITDPFHLTGADSHITSMEAHKKILDFARANGREVWFDVHVGTEGPTPEFGGFFSYADALDKLAGGAKHHLLTFEFNANNHALRRGLANAAGIIRIERDGRIPISTSANCLQPDGENDNDWDQGLLFLNPSHAWLQPPGYVLQMISRNYQPLAVQCDVDAGSTNIEACATRSTDGKTLVLQIVNYSDHSVPMPLDLRGYTPMTPVARVTELSHSLHTENTSDAPERVRDYSFDWRPKFDGTETVFTLAPYSFTIVKFGE